MSGTAVKKFGSRLKRFLDQADLSGFPWKSATILYTISWSWLLIVHDSFWSTDWEMFVFPENTEFDYDSIGLAPWVMKINPILFDVVGPSFLRLFIFASFFFAGIFFYGIAKKIYFLDFVDQKILTLLFLVLPFNTSRVALMVLHYSEAYLLFFFAWYLAVTFKTSAARYICIALFFLSFQMHSMLFFYLLPVLHMFYLSKKTQNKNVRTWLKDHALFLCLPFSYYLLRSFFWPEQVPYHGALVGNIGGTVGFLGFVSFFGLCFYGSYRKANSSNKAPNLMISIGFLAIVVGIYPYVLYGFFPPTASMPFKYLQTFLGRTSWYTRHQTLQPLGISLVIVGSLNFLRFKTRRLPKLCYHFALVGCVVMNLGFGLEHFIDHSKQRKIVSELKVAGESQAVDTYQFIDQTWFLNARGQKMPGIGWRGLIGLAYNSGEAGRVQVEIRCVERENARLILIQGPKTHWDALRNWVGDGDMGFTVTISEPPKACESQKVADQQSSGEIPILFYFTGAKN